MQYDEPLPSFGRTPVSLVETGDPVGQRGEEVLVARHVLVGGVPPIGQEREMEMPPWIRQVVHLEPFEGLFDVRLAGEQGGHHDHGAQLGRHTASEFELAEQPGWHEKRDQAMDQGHRDIGGGHEGEHPQEDEDRYADSRAPAQPQRAGEHERSEDGNQSEVARSGMGPPCASDPDAHGDSKVQPSFERPPATRHQMVSGVLRAPLGSCGRRGLRFRWGGRLVGAGLCGGARVCPPCRPGQRQRFLRHLQFRSR
jgi:hypothetical protein